MSAHRDTTRSSAVETAWGGLRGAPLPADRQTIGTRIVTERGEHGVVTYPPGYSIRLGGVPLDSGHTAIRLDNGVSLYASTPTLSAERRRPDPARVEPALPTLSTDPRYPPDPGARMSAGQLYRALLRARDELAVTSGRPPVEHLRAGMAATLHPLLRWVETHPDHPERAEMSDRELARLRYEVYGTDSPFAVRELALLQALRPDWTRDYREGDGVAVLDEATAAFGPGWTLQRIEGEQALVSRAGQRRRVPLWRLQVTSAGPRPRLPADEPARFDDLLEDNLAHPYTDGFTAARFTERAAREIRAFLPGVLRTWLGELGLDVAVRRTYSTYTIQPRRGAFTPVEIARLQALLPDARWRGDGLELYYRPDFGSTVRRLFHLPVAPEHAERLSMLVSESLRARGFAVSRVGEERRAEAARSCQTLSFDLPGHGRVRVDCGDSDDPSAWHSLFLGDRRYAWGAGQWLQNKVPPVAVLDAVRQRGIRVFG